MFVCRMAVSFAKAPLLELIAELRWLAATPAIDPGSQQSVAQPILQLSNARGEEFFMRLGGELYQLGFQRSERLLPPGFPTIPGQVVFRYKSDKAPQKSVLYQVGPGVFSVNGIPPYQSWLDFSPSVTHGVEALLKARPAEQQGQPFTQVSLRYIDLFGEELIQGRHPMAFVAEVLGISTKIPDILLKFAKPGDVPNIFWRIVMPLEIGTLTIQVGDGKANNQSGIVMDTTISSTVEVPPDRAAIMKRLDDAHAVTNEIFLHITKPIYTAMEPKE
jgi:uncharacterized protein (TIGR04255 family)